MSSSADHGDDCFQPALDNFALCAAAVDNGTIVTRNQLTAVTANSQPSLCSKPACQKLFAVLRELAATGCAAAQGETAIFPNAGDYCPVPTPTNKTPLPTTKTPAPTTKTPAPTTSTPKPVLTTEPPVPTSTPVPTPETPEPVITEPAVPTTQPPVTTTPRPVTTTSAPVTLVPDITTLYPLTGPTAAPTQVPTTKDGLSTTTIAAAGGSGFGFVLILFIVILCLRCKRKPKLDDLVPAHGEHGFTSAPGTTPPTYRVYAYTAASPARTDDDTLTEMDLRCGGLTNVRIPFGTLQFGQVISRGGSGEVTHGRYKHKQVAVKRLLEGRRNDAHCIRSFLKEIQLTATLDHECIVKFIGVSWDIPANLCMVSEFMVGGDLRSLLEGFKQGGHPNGHDDTKLRMAVQVAHGLTYLHTLAMPIVHRDLKSRNILLSSEGDAKLIDFGISCESQDVTMTAGVGTSLWMAPEVMLGHRYDEKADVFSFGVILSELDTHELPYDHTRDSISGEKISNLVLMRLISEGKMKPRFTRMADPQIVSLASKCLEVDPVKRPLASEVMYRVHQILRNDRQRALNSYMAIDRSVMPLNTAPSAGYGYDF